MSQNRQNKIGLVLEGGGGKGAYQIGVWKAMREFGLDRQVQAIAGSSVGGLNAALFVQGDFELAHHIWTEELNRIRVTRIQMDLAKLIEDYMDFSKIMESPIDCFLAAYTPGQHGEYRECNNARNIPEKYVCGEMTYYNLRAISPKDCFILFQTCTTPKAVMLATSAMPVLCQFVWIGGKPHKDGGLKDLAPFYPLAFGSDCDTVLVIHLNQSEKIDQSQFPGVRLLEIIPNVSPRELSMLKGTLNFDPSHARLLVDAGYRDACALFQNWMHNSGIAQIEEQAEQERKRHAQERAQLSGELQEYHHLIMEQPYEP